MDIEGGGTAVDAGEVDRLKRKVARLERELERQSHLLKDVNHRAKNSLQMAMALLSMQALASDNPAVTAALQAASQRLGYLARVHELLYQRGDDIQEIEIGLFLRDIAEALKNAFRRPEIAVVYDISALSLDVSRAISVALIAGEAMLNSYKYAFPPPSGGTIRLVCKPEGDAVRLAIVDDGAGFEVDRRRGSLGMRLLRALGRSLGGETGVRSRPGTSVEVRFPMASADH